MAQWHESQAGHGRKALLQRCPIADGRTHGLNRAGDRAAPLRNRRAAGSAAQEPIVVDDTPEDPRYPEALHRDLYLQGSKRRRQYGGASHASAAAALQRFQPFDLEGSHAQPADVCPSRRKRARLPKLDGALKVLDLTGATPEKRVRRRRVVAVIDLAGWQPVPQPRGPFCSCSGKVSSSCSNCSSHEVAEASGSREHPTAACRRRPDEEQLIDASQAPINLIERSQDSSSAAEIAPVECLRAPERMFEYTICYDEHSMEDCYISSMCGHRMCRDAARKVTKGAIMYIAAAF